MVRQRGILEVGYNRINKKAIRIEDVPKTKNGWIDATKYASKRIEIVSIKSHIKGNEYPGWWTGDKWYSRTKPESLKVYWWKDPRHEEAIDNNTPSL